MRLYGLTGGIASGKSTVSSMLTALGAPLIDADVVAREVVAPGTAGLQDIAERFPGVVSENGVLDRKALGARVFSRPEERAALNAIVHPRIRDRVAELTVEHEARGAPFVVYDAALLIENGLHGAMDGVILVAVPLAVQRERLVQRDGLTEADADARIAAQMPLSAKRPFARWIIDNAGPLEATRAQVERLFAELTEDAGA